MTNKFILAAVGNSGGGGAIVTGAVLHWDFGDTSCWNRTNSTVTDLSGNGHHSTIQSYNSGNESHSFNSNKGGYLEASNSGGATLSMSGLANGPYFTHPLFFRNTYSVNTSFWGVNSVSAPYTLEFISDHTLPSNRLTFPSSGLGIFAAGTATPSALYDYCGISTQTGSSIAHRMSLIINADGSGSASEISEYGFGTGGRNVFNLSYRDINDHTPNANLTYPYNTAGDTTGWQQIIAAYDGSDFTLYRNGVIIYGPIGNTNNYRHAQNSLFSGDERFYTAQGGWGIIRGYDRALTSAEVSGQYNAQKSRFGI